MVSRSMPPRRGAEETRRITAVSLIAGDEQVVIPVSPKPFVYRAGMRLRIDIIGPQAFLAETP
jgi:hypothetical protein